MFVCLFVLYSQPHRWTDSGETRWEDGHRAGIGFSKISDPIRQPVCHIFSKNTRFFRSEFPLSGGCRVAEWNREKSVPMFGLGIPIPSVLGPKIGFRGTICPKYEQFARVWMLQLAGALLRAHALKRAGALHRTEALQRA